MALSSSLQIPTADSPAGPSRHHTSASSRPVSATVQQASVSASSPSGNSRRQRASHTVVSSSSSHEPSSNGHRQNGKERNHDGQTPYTDVYSHPAAVAYAAAHPKRTIPKFGPYLLLQTLGEGEFGKVKLGLHSQWGEEVAVKLIRRGNIDTAVRMSKVEREIEVLRTLKHPNIVRLYDVIETDKYIGIIIEYASGGELFDHILAHRYLREKDAAKLFSQLISGVWYIHQKKIVHRDLKLENLLLDRNRNVLITDFGFANRFEHRSDDLMQTSCGSPCYAAPELVISEGLYVGSAVDIWSCGVILYAMLAGYLPFDDDPANPDGDNINLLYKYIVNTPLSFPDYISEAARSLLSMMLVPDPARRASLEHVMAHPWLSAYALSRDDLANTVVTAFGRTVDDLERFAMDQHQQKRLAYQRQMRATQPSSSDRVGRSQSHRPDNGHSSAVTLPPNAPRSSSVQAGLVYETSPEHSQSMTYSPPPVSAPISREGYDNGLIDGDDPFAPPPGISSAEVAKGKKATRPHTVQVEYDGPRERERQSRKERATDSQDGDRERERRRNEPSTSQSYASATNGTPRTPEKKRRTSNAAIESKPLPAQPSASVPSDATPHVRDRTTSTPRGRQPAETPSITLASPPGTPIVFSSSEAATEDADKDKESQSSSRASKHNRTPSAVAKFFSGTESNGGSSTLLSPSIDKESTSSATPSTDKKSRRGSLTVMIGRTIKGRKGRTATTPVSAIPPSETTSIDAAPASSHPPTSYSEVTSRTPIDVDDSTSGDGTGMQASTGKAKKVMHWFRSRSKARDSVGIMDPNQSHYEEEATSGEQYHEKSASSSTVNQQRVSIQTSTPSAKRSSSNRQSHSSVARTPSSATDASVNATPSFVTRFRNSVTVGGSEKKQAGGVLRIHHGPLDQDMVTQHPPHEVIARIKQVLIEMGIEVQLESEFKYRCIRAKRKKQLGALTGSLGPTGGLAAVTMMGTAASNGVDKRGLPVPSHGSFSGGGMLRGLLMRRQSSQVSGSGSTSQGFEDDTPDASVLVSEPGNMLEPLFGDHPEDVGDEVRFSVELTRLALLKDTFSVDIRRLKGNLRSYKFLYDTIRSRAQLATLATQGRAV